MYKKSFVSLSISPTKLQLLQLNSTKKAVLKVVSSDLPAGIIASYKVSDPQKLSEILKNIWKQNGINERSVGIIVPEFSTYTKTLKLPQLEYKELNEAVRWQAQEFLPDSGKEMVLDWKIIKSVDKDYQILAVAIPQAILTGYVQSVSLAGLYPLIVETPSLSIVRVASDATECRLIIYSSLGEAILILANGERIIGSIVASSSDQKGILTAALSLSKRYSEENPQRVIIGGLQISQDLLTGLQDELKLPVEWVKNNVAGLNQSQLQEYLVPLSMQFKDPTEPADETTINLLPPNWVKQYQMKKLKLQIWTSLIISTLVIGGCLIASILVFIALQTQLQSLKSIGKEIKSTGESLQSDIQSINNVALKVNKITAVLPPGSVINALTRSIKPGIVINKYFVAYEEGVVKIEGTAADRQSLLNFKKSLDDNKDFSGVFLPISALLAEQNIKFNLEFAYLPLKPKAASPATLTIPK